MGIPAGFIGVRVVFDVEVGEEFVAFLDGVYPVWGWGVVFLVFVGEGVY